jgi:protein HOOK3
MVQKQQELSSEDKPGKYGHAPFSVDDIELELESRYGSLIAQNKALEEEKKLSIKRLADTTARLETLQDHNDVLQDRLKAAEDGLSGAVKEAVAVKAISNLEAKVHEQDELIASQEAQIEQDRIEKARLRKDLDRLSSASNLAAQLQDEIKEFKYENLELTKKANTVERFKQKLEQQRNFEVTIRNLESANEDLRDRVKDFELLKRRNDSLEVTNKQYENTLSEREIEIFELSSRKRTVEQENAGRQRSIAKMEAERLAAENHISELQEQLNRHHSVTSPLRPSLPTLEDELEESEQIDIRNDFEISKLKAENQLLRGNAAAAQENASLRLQLEEAERLRKSLEARCKDLFEKHVISSQQIKAMLEASTAEGLVKYVNIAMLIGPLSMLTPEYYSSQAYSELHKQHLETSEQKAALERGYHELETELEDLKRRLLTVTTDRELLLIIPF